MHHQVTEWITQVRNEVRRQLPSDTEQDAEQVLMAVQEQLLQELLVKNEAGLLELRSRGLQASDFAEVKVNLVKERETLVSCLGEEWQEKRFLRFAFLPVFPPGSTFLFSGSWKLMMR